MEAEIAGLLEKAELADAEKIDDPKLPKTLARRQALKDKLYRAVAHLEEEARAAAQATRPVYEAKKAAWDEKAAKRQVRGTAPVAPDPLPKDSQIINLTDHDAKLMRKSKHDPYFQAYNGQAVVDADGSQLILVTDVLQTPSDQPGFASLIDQLSDEDEVPTTVLADAGYGDGQAVEGLKALEELGNKAEYRKRKQTVEPVFGIIKSALGFTHFLTRGLQNVKTEWSLIATAYNIKRLHRLIQQG